MVMIPSSRRLRTPGHHVPEQDAGPVAMMRTIVDKMTAALHILWPIWTRTVGAMSKRNILVRSQCRRCGALMRVDPADLVARYGAGHSLIDTQERCRMVACDGAAYYLAARTYGAPWRVLLDDPVLKEGLEGRPPAVTGRSLQVCGQATVLDVSP